MPSPSQRIEVEEGGAWDPKSRTPLTGDQPPSPPKDTTSKWPPELEIGYRLTGVSGQWLLDNRLVMRKLDVRIQGTRSTNPPWQNGKFEGQLGFVVLTEPAQSLNSSTIVKTGFAQNRALLQIRHLIPETSTERPTFKFMNSAQGPDIYPILSVPGSRVVIIGPDCNDSRDYIGDYAVVAASPYPLRAGEGLVQIATPGRTWGHHVYVPGGSVCRSDTEGAPIDWFGTKLY